MPSPSPVSELALVEAPALQWLQEAGWTHRRGPTLRPADAPHERSLDADVVLRATLLEAVARLNPELPPEAVTRAVELALTSTQADLLLDHRDFHEVLLGGVPVSWLDPERGERHGRARLVDWTTPADNRFEVVDQLTIVQGGNNRRPDLLLYVNGLPLGQLELKRPDPTGEAAVKAVNQVRHYRKTIRGLYRYVEVIGVSDLLRARVGTITTPAEHFAEWKSMEEPPAGSPAPPQLKTLIDGVFAPAGFLDLVRNFVLFESDGAKTWKVMAKYHQVDAVNRAVEATREAMADRSRRAGVVWHTQGAGKSYSMLFFVTKLRRDPSFRNPTIVCVTDTIDLDNQLAETFARQTHLAPVVARAERIAGDATPGPEDRLYALLDVPADGIVFTTIQKFGRRKDEPPIPVLSERENVVVIADEAHRSQYAGLAQNLLTALPNATRIGFTGTPIESGDRSTRAAFGDYISVYRMARAQDDGATVPIYYESRQVPVAADRDELQRLQAMLDRESEEAQTELSGDFARMDAIIGSPERLDRVTADVVEHFRGRPAGKAMLVAYSRRAAAEYALRLRAELGEDAVDAVMNAAATDERPVSDFRKSKPQQKDLERRFKDPDDPLRVVVAKNMWLTGFDAPVLHTLYIDKPMRDHGLLQAIARVNRVFGEKRGGLVVDYIGIGDDLRAGLRAFASGDVDDVVVELATAQGKLRELHEVLCDLLHGITWTASAEADPAEKATVYAAGVAAGIERFAIDAVRLADDASSGDGQRDAQADGPADHGNRARIFLEQQRHYESWFSLVSPNEPALEQRLDRDVFAQIASGLRALARPGRDDRDGASGAARRAVEQFFSDGLAGGEIVDVFALSGDERPEISVLSDEFLDDLAGRATKPDVKIALLKKLLAGEVSTRLGGNRIQHKRFSDELGALLERYTARQITSAEVIAKLVELAKDLRAQGRRNEELGLSREEGAFYDALAGQGEDWVADPRLKDIAAKVVEQVRGDLAVDWTERGNLEARVRSRIKRLLRKHRPALGLEAGGGLDDVAERVFLQARAMYRRWPEVEGDLEL